MRDEGLQCSSAIKFVGKELPNIFLKISVPNSTHTKDIYRTWVLLASHSFAVQSAEAERKVVG